MNLGLFYDTETTNLPLWSTPSEDPAQPHMVQISASLVDMESRKAVAGIDFTIKPDGWVIPDETIAIHGVTNEFANRVGISESFALDAFMRLYENADVRIGHEESFDARIIRIAQFRFGTIDEVADEFKAAPAQCTLKLAQAIMGGKKPTLTEAHKYFTGFEFANAHSARADVDATIRVYWAIQDHKPKARGRRA